MVVLAAGVICLIIFYPFALWMRKDEKRSWVVDHTISNIFFAVPAAFIVIGGALTYFGLGM